MNNHIGRFKYENYAPGNVYRLHSSRLTLSHQLAPKDRRDRMNKHRRQQPSIHLGENPTSIHMQGALFCPVVSLQHQVTQNGNPELLAGHTVTRCGHLTSSPERDRIRLVVFPFLLDLGVAVKDQLLFQ